jgi:CheY-like chemotaxis protein
MGSLMAKNKNNRENDRKTILIVDDEETLTWSMSKNLSMNKQYKVICANSTEEALKILKKTSNINLIVSDIKMAGKSGLELLDEVKEHRPQIGFVAMTAYGSDENKHQALEKGALRYIEKPFGVKTMIQVIGEVLEEMDRLGQPQEQLKYQVKSQAAIAKILSNYTQDIKEVIFVKLNAMEGDILFQVGLDLVPVGPQDLPASGLVNKTKEICQQLTLGNLELIAISTEKHYILLHHLADQQLFLYSLVEKKLGLGKALYIMKRLTEKIANTLRGKINGKYDNEV